MGLRECPCDDQPVVGRHELSDRGSAEVDERLVDEEVLLRVPFEQLGQRRGVKDASIWVVRVDDHHQRGPVRHLQRLQLEAEVLLG
jgi:hypothetical protein